MSQSLSVCLLGPLLSEVRRIIGYEWTGAIDVVGKG